MKSNTHKIVGPIIVSALSLFICFHLIDPIAFRLDPTFSLFATRGIGKIAIMVLVIYHIILFLLVQPYTFMYKFFSTSWSFYTQERWFGSFCRYFCLFALLHMLVLGIYTACNVGTLNWPHHFFSFSLFLQLVVGFIATFFLAWGEEVIFRAMLYQYFAQFYRPITSALVTSMIFSLSHNLASPLTLITTQWRLGIGLFLLGLLLNLIFIITKKLYTSMGAHAGLVFIKVALRRLPLISFASGIDSMLLFHSDLRQSLIVHALFCIAIVTLCFVYKKNFLTSSQ